MNLLFGLSLAFLLAAAPLRAQILEQSFSDTAAGFRISSPGAGWHFEPRGAAPGPLRATIRFETPVDQFVPNVTVHVTLLENPKIKAGGILAEELAAFPSRIELVEKKPAKSGETAGYELILHDPESRKIFHQRFFVAKGKSFVITCTSNKESYPRMQRDFQKILDSFAIL